MRPGRPGRWRWLLLVSWLCGLAALAATAAPSPPAVRRADVRVQGLGWIRNYQLRQTLLLLLGDERQATLGSNGIEDAALIVFSTLGDDGYLDPSVGTSRRNPFRRR